VRDPRGLLTEWGTILPYGVRLRVVDSTADYRWMVLPTRPAGTEGWDEPQLASIVREGDMIGVTVPTA
jgi:nitrile hydratase